MEFSYTKNIITERFVYRLQTDEKIIYDIPNIMVSTDPNDKKVHETIVSETHIKPITLGVEYPIPKKKVVWDAGNMKFIPYEIGIYIFSKEWIEKYTFEIEDTDKFQETHNKAHAQLLSELKTKNN
jgi:hypothetical protein